VSHVSTRSTAALCLASLLVVLSAQRPGAQQPSAPPGQPAPPPQQEQPQPSQPPRFRTEANYVRVDVYPTKDGVPVQDLRAEEFELLEDGGRQSIQAFEHVVISPAGPQSLRAEANSVRGGEAMAGNPRNRVFVIFLDVPHVAVEGSHAIKEPLIRLIDRILGPDDLIAVMTPEMSAAQITFGRKTEVIADMLRDKWTWGVRHSIVPMDQREIEYEQCYPNLEQKGLVEAMKARRRERMVLDALHDLVKYLGGVREERKAILAVTDGWVLYKPDASITTLRQDPMTGRFEPIPGQEPIGVDGVGKLRVGAERARTADPVSTTVCDRERMYLSSIDNDEHFRYLMDVANRNNASFYPIDPRGLAVFDYPMGPGQPPSLAVDAASLRTRLESLRTLAENTDGMAVVNSNDLDKGLRKIADDLTSYYLLGYYSSNAKLDGGFRRITVRVKRPGIQVRARRGYRAANAEEVNASRTAAAAPVPDNVRTTNAAVASLDRIRPDSQFAINAVPVRGAGGEITAVWIAGELQMSAAARDFTTGGSAAIDLDGGANGSVTAELKPGERTFLVKVPVQTLNDAINVRARLTSPAVTTPITDAARVEQDRAAQRALLFRRGPSTGNRVLPAGDFRFSRTERLRLELPIPSEAATGTGRFLDRKAQPLQIPVQVADKTDADGQRWLTADATLSALGAGDYVVELSYTVGTAEQRVATGIRVTR
jgi:VWFA-related protein